MAKRAHLGLFEALHEYNVNLSTRTVYLHGDIDAETCAEAVRNLTYLTGLSSDPIYIDICSSGGDVDPGLSLYDTIASAVSSGIDVRGVVRGSAESMACVILQACSQRYVHKNATIMHHRGETAQPRDTRPEEHESQATYVRRQYDRIDDLVYQRVKAGGPGGWYTGTFKAFQKATAKAIFMTAQEAVESGFADYVI